MNSLAGILTILGLLADGPSLYEMAEKDVDNYLAELNTQQPDFTTRVNAIAEQSLGSPYAGDPLGEGPGGAYDKDPQMDLAHVDCVTFIEQTLALAASDSYHNAHETLQKIRYKSENIAYENRNHFMAVDWILNNTFCKDVTQKLDIPTQTATRTIGRKHFFELKELPAFAEKARDPVATLAFVPAAKAEAAEKKLPSPALILFIGKIDWLFTLHCGLYLRDPEGAGALYHASSKEKKVVKNSLSAMFENNNRYLGLCAYEITNPRSGKGNR